MKVCGEAFIASTCTEFGIVPATKIQNVTSDTMFLIIPLEQENFLWIIPPVIKILIFKSCSFEFYVALFNATLHNRFSASLDTSRHSVATDRFQTFEKYCELGTKRSSESGEQGSNALVVAFEIVRLAYSRLERGREAFHHIGLVCFCVGFITQRHFPIVRNLLLSLSRERETGGVGWYRIPLSQYVCVSTKIIFLLLSTQCLSDCTVLCISSRFSIVLSKRMCKLFFLGGKFAPILKENSKRGPKRVWPPYLWAIFHFSSLGGDAFSSLSSNDNPHTAGGTSKQSTPTEKGINACASAQKRNLVSSCTTDWGSSSFLDWSSLFGVH